MGDGGTYTIRRTIHTVCITIAMDSICCTKEEEVMSTKIESVLYIDIQKQIPAGFCSHCGGELYAPSLVCLRCEGRML